MIPSSNLPTFDAVALLEWYKTNGRALLWRKKVGDFPNPYHVWLSEIMLQQTVVKTVIPYFEKFITKWPTVQDLGKASLDDVFKAWAGLGYYRRAENLLKAAKVLADKPSFPSKRDEILSLPGVGEYTASAIAAIAFNSPVIPVDGNLERITARFFALEDPLPQNKKKIDQYAQHLNKLTVAQKDASDFTQALFDLGATVCTPKNPNCNKCPVNKNCLGKKAGVAATLPIKTPKKAKKELYASFFVLLRKSKQNTFDVYLKKRPEGELLGNTFMPPSSEWLPKEHLLSEGLEQAFTAKEQASLEHVNWLKATSLQHIFTHIKLKGTVYYAVILESSDELDGLTQGRFYAENDQALSTLAVKMFRNASNAARCN